MSGAELTLRVLRTVAESADRKLQSPSGQEGLTPSLALDPDPSVTSQQMLEALIATDFDLPGAIVRVAGGD